MGIPVLIIGRSGAGKSASLRNFKENELGVINVLGKPLPFKSKIIQYVTDDYSKIKKAIIKTKTKSVVIDDAGYLITNHFMKGHSCAGGGNAVFAFYNQLGDEFWGLIDFITHQVDKEKIVYLMMHEDKNEFGDIKPKTIGKLLDEKVCVEGLFTVCLRAGVENGEHFFYTRQTDRDVSKTPIGMFEEEKIDNDLHLVDVQMRDYYGLEIKEEEKGETNHEETMAL